MTQQQIDPADTEAGGEPRIELRTMTIDDYEDMVEATKLAYAGIGGQPWSRKQIERLISLFPDGQLCVVVDGTAVGFALSLIVDYSALGDKHSYEEVIGGYEFNTHDPAGDVLYGIDVMVHDEHRGMRLARRLYEGRKALCEHLNLRSIVAGGRIPGYAEHAETLTPQQYVDKVADRELYDPVLSFQLANNFHVRRVLRGYLKFDTESKAFATLIEWNNVMYHEGADLLRRQNSLVRIGIVQMLMQPLQKLDQLVDQCEYYIDSLAAVRCDFVLLPELFNMGLMASFGNCQPSEAIRKLAEHSTELRERLVHLAMKHNTNVIAGSLPVMEGDSLYNIAYLCRRDGTWDEQRKIHITPSERRWWGMTGGDTLRALDTDCGKIGILICYDSEFPELSRVLADQGMGMLFVPFLTELQSGYQRVRHCARARAIENECYVAIAGAVGSLPAVKASDVHYAQSAVFTPSDFAFPSTCMITEASPNSDALLVAEVNLDLLRNLNRKGTVTILNDRRKELYSVVWKGK